MGCVCWRSGVVVWREEGPAGWLGGERGGDHVAFAWAQLGERAADTWLADAWGTWCRYMGNELRGYRRYVSAAHASVVQNPRQSQAVAVQSASYGTSARQE